MQVWVNTDDVKNVTATVKSLEKSIATHADKELKAFVVFMNPKSEDAEKVADQLEKVATDAKSQKVALTYIAGPKDKAVQLYGINADPKVKNTIFVYKDKKTATKFVNFVADEKSLAALDKAIGEVVH